jgi:tetrahydromethanopterin S-methyltransferase subunit C
MGMVRMGMVRLGMGIMAVVRGIRGVMMMGFVVMVKMWVVVRMMVGARVGKRRKGRRSVKGMK